MSYTGSGLRGLRGLGLASLGSTAEEQARARQLNEDQGVVNTTVGPGFWDDWVDAALIPSGISSVASSRVPAAIRSVLESSGNQVDRVVWGGGAGLESIAGKVYVRWKPTRPENAVTYADIARALFQRAADQFAAGARLTMQRYRIPGAPLAPLRGGFYNDHFVYPTGGALPASAPEAARGTNVENLPLDNSPEQILPPKTEQGAATVAGVAHTLVTAATVGIAVLGGVAVIGGGYYVYKKTRVRKNRRRSR